METIKLNRHNVINKFEEEYRAEDYAPNPLSFYNIHQIIEYKNGNISFNDMGTHACLLIGNFIEKLISEYADEDYIVDEVDLYK